MILHIDMDAFFTSVEQLDNPHLRGKCLVVGGHSKRGVVAAASYEARKYGIYSAMPIFMARQRCSNLVIVPPRRERYKSISCQIMSILKHFSPIVEPVSIDEAFIDISDCLRLHGTPLQIGTQIKKNIRTTTGLTCSVGAAPIKFLAKIASDLEKPDGLTIIEPEAIAGFIDTLAIDKVPGIGKITSQRLAGLGIRTLGAAGQLSPQVAHKHLGKFGYRLIQLSKGIDPSPVTPDTLTKSISTEITLAKDTTIGPHLNRYLINQSEIVGRQLRRAGFKAKTFTLKIKHSDFMQTSRSITLRHPAGSSKIILSEIRKLLKAYTDSRPIRLIGIALSNLVPESSPVQMELFSDKPERSDNWSKIEQTVDTITEKFGSDAIYKANLGVLKIDKD